ncbi:SDR family NAD(P)-dependent oxidoreductase [Amycolatopsis sp. H20-H5]|uniref:SDR family NAD(P)-dependent oxidoreductase n=1 Tax=Amycolatopsis sp. H20-H5 TaxID=3046309 RepID=UPI002DB6D074|nr:SDR family NAD(P)-dependent oxidoreductase [Amycolatopsis sp. H20-H5]MEC3977967.1 SDR family NAD(P)-dependent oxidoreductase [Amycolatopsis sp. H20-H5]
MGVLEGKAVMVTGAGRGLGLAYAQHAAASGAAVVVNDVDVELAEEVAEGIRASDRRVVASGHSVTDDGQAAAIIELCVTEFGAIDGLVDNAALNHKALPWDDDPTRVRALVDVNVLEPLFCGMAAATAMRERGGVVVNVASGLVLGQPKAAAYSASKGAVASMTFSCAVDLAAHGIRVNAVCPLAWTRMIWDDPIERENGNPELSPDRIAPLVTFLLSDLAAGVTGQLVRFQGDRLHVVRQPGIKQPGLQRDHWEVEDFAAAFDGGLEGRRGRW